MIGGLLNDLLSPVVSLLSGLLNSVSQILNSITIKVFFIPQLNGYLSNIDRLLPTIYTYYKNNSFHNELIVYYTDLIREILILKNSPTPVTNIQFEQDKANVQILQQQYYEVISDYIRAFSTNCSSTCSNITIQVANCSCFSSSEVEIFLNDFVYIYAPLEEQNVAFFVNKLTAQDDNDAIVSDVTLAAIGQTQQDVTDVYQYIYSTNGNVNKTQVAASLTKISADLHLFAADLPTTVDTDPFETQPL